MKKILNRALLKKAQESREAPKNPKNHGKEGDIREGRAQAPCVPSVGGVGSAWKAGAAEQNRTALVQSRQKIAEDILAGKYVLEIKTDRIIDHIGTDRCGDWQDQDALNELRESIKKNGQDTPIRVWPASQSCAGSKRL